MQITKEDLRKETDFECTMRKRVWPMYDPKNNNSFKKSEHQRRFDLMRYNYALLSVMTDKEFAVLAERIERRIQEHQQQQQQLDL